MSNMAVQATITFYDGPHANRTYQLKDPSRPLPAEVVVTDGGNTLEDSNGYIIGHYIGMYDPDTDGELPNPDELPPC